MTMNKDLLFLLIVLTAMSLAVVCFLLERRLRLARQEKSRLHLDLVACQGRLAGLERQIAASRQQGPARSASGAPFAERLQQVDLRRHQQGGVRSERLVERYRLVGAMARRGLPAEEICGLLHIPRSETEQLLKLAQVGRQAA